MRPSLLPGLSVLENVALPAIFSSNGLRATANERAAALIKSVGLDDKIQAYPRQLVSYGTRSIEMANGVICA